MGGGCTRPTAAPARLTPSTSIRPRVRSAGGARSCGSPNRASHPTGSPQASEPPVHLHGISGSIRRQHLGGAVGRRRPAVLGARRIADPNDLAPGRQDLAPGRQGLAPGRQDLAPGRQAHALRVRWPRPRDPVHHHRPPWARRDGPGAPAGRGAAVPRRGPWRSRRALCSLSRTNHAGPETGMRVPASAVDRPASAGAARPRAHRPSRPRGTDRCGYVRAPRCRRAARSGRSRRGRCSATGASATWTRRGARAASLAAAGTRGVPVPKSVSLPARADEIAGGVGRGRAS